jgi:adenylate cyclase
MNLTKEAIIAQLEKIVGSEEFNGSYKLQRFLSFIVLETLENRADNLKQYNIAVNAFDRAKNFDANLDPIVRIQASRLRSSLISYYLNTGKEDIILIDIPKGSYKPSFSERIASVSSIETPPFNDSEIAVEAFKNLSGDDAKQYIVDGFTEELLLELARYDHLTIIRLPSIAGEINLAQRFARFVLRGSIRFDNARIKLVVLVEDIKEQDIIWSKKFDLPITPGELINSQEEIAKSVANTIGDVIGGIVVKRLLKESRQRTIDNMIAYDALLKFYYYQKVPMPERYLDALEITNKVLSKDQENGICWAILSDLAIDSIALGLDMTNKDGFDKALLYALKGVEYEPNMQLTRTYLSYAYLMNNQFDKVIEEADKAIDLNPNAAFYVGSLGWLMALAGSWEKGLSYIEEGIYLNPGYPLWYHQATCLHYLGMNDFESALLEANKLNIPELFWDPLLKIVCYAHLGLLEEATKQKKLLLDLNPNFIKDGEGLIKMYVKEERHFASIVDGLIKTGIDISLH